MKHPNPREFLEFASEWPSITKIFNLCSVPNILMAIGKDPFVFPFEEKKVEVVNIDSHDEKELQQLRMTTDIHADYLDYLSNLYFSLKSILYLYRFGDAEIQMKSICIKILQNQIHILNDHETKWFIGRYMPFFMLDVHHTREANMISVVATLHWFLQPQETFICHLDWEKWIIAMLQDYRLELPRFRG